MLGFKRFLNEEEASGVVELILIIVVLIAIVVIFKDRIGKLVDNMLKKIDADGLTILGEQAAESKE